VSIYLNLSNTVNQHERGHLNLSVGHLNLSVGHLNLSVGHLNLSVGHLNLSVEVILGLAALNSNLLFVIKKLLDEKVRLMLNTTSKYRFLHSQIISGYQIIVMTIKFICL
jgi:hypothetical protein